MHADTATATLKAWGADAPAYPNRIPAWMKAVDAGVIALLNVALAIQVVLVFVSTMVRTLFHSSTLMWVDE